MNVLSPWKLFCMEIQSKDHREGAAALDLHSSVLSARGISVLALSVLHLHLTPSNAEDSLCSHRHRIQRYSFCPRGFSHTE